MFEWYFYNGRTTHATQYPFLNVANKQSFHERISHFGNSITTFCAARLHSQLLFLLVLIDIFCFLWGFCHLLYCLWGFCNLLLFVGFCHFVLFVGFSSFCIVCGFFVIFYCLWGFVIFYCFWGFCNLILFVGFLQSFIVCGFFVWVYICREQLLWRQQTSKKQLESIKT